MVNGNVVVEMFLICHVILPDLVIKRSCYFMGGSLNENLHPAKFGVRRHCDCGNLFLVIENQDSTFQFYSANTISL